MDDSELQTTQTAGNRHVSHLGNIRKLDHGGDITDQGQLTRTAIRLFRLDNALSLAVNLLCFGAAGDDGMPVVFSHRISSNSVRPEQFQIITRSGQLKKPECATLRPAGHPGERRTVLLMGESGNADTEPPEVVTVVEDLLSDTTEPLNFRGQSVEVTPRNEGPSMVSAESPSRNDWAFDRRGTQCPSEGVRQIIRVT